ncbi:unnamed protein product [Linum trigynum]|uniref:Uncharacterized protein n=1 Tax=Linum trigynum TaxID=586398 RepID=A0AAV2DDH1_9ROSI
MGRTPCCDKDEVKKGAWSSEEDQILFDYINKHGHGSWRTLPKNAGLLRCGKSCRLRWTNYLRPDIKRGPFTPDEEATIVRLQGELGNKWAAIASHMPGRTDNEIKNFWNTHLKKRLSTPPPALPSTNIKIEGDSSSPLATTTRHIAQWESTRVEAEARLSSLRPGQQQQQQHKFDQDYYLKLWNSDIGKSFRDINKVQKDGRGGGGCESSTSQASSLTKLGSGSVDDDTLATTTPTTTMTKTCSAAATIKRSASSEAIHHQHEVEGGLCYYYEGMEETKPCHLDVMMSSSDSITSTTNEFTNYSDTALKQLLDIPGGSGMDFLEDESDDFINFLDLRCV